MKITMLKTINFKMALEIILFCIIFYFCNILCLNIQLYGICLLERRLYDVPGTILFEGVRLYQELFFEKTVIRFNENSYWAKFQKKKYFENIVLGVTSYIITDLHMDSRLQAIWLQQNYLLFAYDAYRNTCFVGIHKYLIRTCTNCIVTCFPHDIEKQKQYIRLTLAIINNNYISNMSLTWNWAHLADMLCNFYKSKNFNIEDPEITNKLWSLLIFQEAHIEKNSELLLRSYNLFEKQTSFFIKQQKELFFKMGLAYSSEYDTPAGLMLTFITAYDNFFKEYITFEEYVLFLEHISVISETNYHISSKGFFYDFCRVLDKKTDSQKIAKYIEMIKKNKWI